MLTKRDDEPEVSDAAQSLYTDVRVLLDGGGVAAPAPDLLARVDGTR